MKKRTATKKKRKTSRKTKKQDYYDWAMSMYWDSVRTGEAAGGPKGGGVTN